MFKKISLLLITTCMINSCQTQKALGVKVYETSAEGNKLTEITKFSPQESAVQIKILPEEQYQTLLGFGGSFTEASASLLNKLSQEKRKKVLDGYFSENGANYSLTRTHIASCDFSLSNYTYAPVADDMELKNFTIEQDKGDLIPMIKQAQSISKEGFKIVASPWTSPPWMKDNKGYVGGKLLPQYNDVFALYYSKYLEAYKKEGIDIWGLTVINEPNGNGNNWESTIFTPEEMTNFVQHHLGPQLEKDGWGDVKILGYDQNRADLPKWADTMYKDANTSKYFDGMAIHWYESTYDYFPDKLQYTHNKAPNKYMIQTEACADAEVPHWQDDAWYWKKEATDWGWDWASAEEKHLHPKYSPVHRYATDIIGCLNNWVDGWIDWNMVLNRQGGPNWFKNWCLAPVIVDENAEEVYFTPNYYVMAHFSKYIRPGAKRIGFENPDKSLMVTAAQNPDKTIAVVIFNPTESPRTLQLNLGNHNTTITISKEALQTVIIK